MVRGLSRFKKRFALLPVLCGNKKVWFEVYYVYQLFENSRWVTYSYHTKPALPEKRKDIWPKFEAIHVPIQEQTVEDLENTDQRCAGRLLF